MRRKEGVVATEQDYRAILIPTEKFHRLRIADYKQRGHKKKLFKGESVTKGAHTIDDPYYYYIDEGRIVSMFENESGAGTPIFWRNEGSAFSAECFDFASIGRYRARFTATQNTVLFAFSQRQLYEFMQEDPEIFYEFVYVCHVSFAQMAHRLSNTGSQSAVKRIVMWLQKLCAASTPLPDGTYDIPCDLTLQQLSDLLLIHITTCTKIIAMLESDGVIKRTRKGIQVFDAKRLESYGLDEGHVAY